MFTKFTKEMKSTHTILVPTMIDPHFDFMVGVLKDEGYNAQILQNHEKSVVEEGLKSVHNDMCYPALLVIGQFIDALKSGVFDTHKVALLISQTGGGCRASNYINLLRKALVDSGFEYVPVVSLNFSSLDENEFVLSKKALIKIIWAIFYGDLLMTLYNQCVSYEENKGQTRETFLKCVKFIYDQIPNFSYFLLKKNYKFILKEFKKIKLQDIQKVKVGIVGEIYMKYSSLGNNSLNSYLVSEGAEVVNTGLMDFVLTCIYDAIFDKELYGKSGMVYYVSRIVVWFLESRQSDMIKTIKKYGFRAPIPFEEVKNIADGYISHGVKMGEGWLLTAEMVEFIKSGVNNIVCAQPFGCLPNHIIARGMIRKIKEKYPDSNISCIDYDPSASAINQENRIKLMLANAKKHMKI